MVGRREFLAGLAALGLGFGVKEASADHTNSHFCRRRDRCYNNNDCSAAKYCRKKPGNKCGLCVLRPTPEPTPTPTPEPEPEYLYPEPELVNPRIVDLPPTGRVTINLGSTEDCLLRAPEGGRQGATLILGGRNVVLRGGAFSVDPNLPILTDIGGDHTDYRVFRVSGAQHFWVANVLFNNPNDREFDVVAGGGTNSRWTFQNVRAENQLGRQQGFHADIVHPWDGGLRRLDMDLVTIHTNYQGIYLDGLPVSNGINFSRMNLVHTEPNMSSLFWLGGKTASWEDVYVISDRAIEGDGNPGNWIAGTPPGGDFVPAGSVG